MKKLIILFVFGLLARQVAPAQGSITYLSNLGQPSTGSLAVGSDSWQAAGFSTGSNIDGYMLNSIQLALTDAVGDPNSFAVLLYSSPSGATKKFPVSSLGALNGSLNPTAGGVFTYTPASSIILSRYTSYFIVLTAGTTVANGAYEWSYAKGPYNPIGSWRAPPVDGGVDNYQSSNGLTWNYSSAGPIQFAISATPVPEPGVLSLLGLGGAALLWRRRAKTAR